MWHRMQTRMISIHALLAESDPYLKESDFWILIFLSTLSLRRATLTRSTLPAATWYFYPRSPCGERPVHYIYLFCLVYISIHALLAESDRSAKSFFCGILVISIHALLAESDWESNVVDPFVELFLSTLSLRRATMLALNFCTVINISIHALLAESDWMPARQRQTLRYFYPRSPCGERLYAAALCHAAAGISIHALLAESDLPPTTLAPSSSYFYPRSPCGERRCGR